MILIISIKKNTSHPKWITDVSYMGDANRNTLQIPLATPNLKLFFNPKIIIITKGITSTIEKDNSKPNLEKYLRLFLNRSN